MTGKLKFLDIVPRLIRIPFVAPGNLAQMWGRHGWAFQRELCDSYGAVVQVKGLFGVRLKRLAFRRCTSLIRMYMTAQNKELFVFDPAALHHMCIEESDVYEETEFSLS